MCCFAKFIGCARLFYNLSEVALKIHCFRSACKLRSCKLIFLIKSGVRYYLMEKKRLCILLFTRVEQPLTTEGAFHTFLHWWQNSWGWKGSKKLQNMPPSQHNNLWLPLPMRSFVGLPNMKVSKRQIALNKGTTSFSLYFCQWFVQLQNKAGFYWRV